MSHHPGHPSNEGPEEFPSTSGTTGAIPKRTTRKEFPSTSGTTGARPKRTTRKEFPSKPRTSNKNERTTGTRTKRTPKKDVERFAGSPVKFSFGGKAHDLKTFALIGQQDTSPDERLDTEKASSSFSPPSCPSSPSMPYRDGSETESASSNFSPSFSSSPSMLYKDALETERDSSSFSPAPLSSSPSMPSFYQEQYADFHKGGGNIIYNIAGNVGNIKHEGSRKTINALKMADNGGTFTNNEHDAKNKLAVKMPSGDTSAEAALLSGVGDVDASNSINSVAAGNSGKLNQGKFDRSNFGQQTNTKHTEVKTIENTTITHVHHHYGGADKDEEPSTSDSRTPKKNSEYSETEEGYIQISDDIFMNEKKPLKEGKQVFEGYQEHASGARLPIAIKRIVPCTDKHVKEVQHLVTLASNPNVVQIIQSKVRQSDVRTLYIAMELCSSQNLYDLLDETRKQKIPLDFKKAMSFTKQLIDGMKFIHSNGVLHRDMKPENVLLSKDKQQIKIADFGLGKQLQQGHSKTKNTVPGQGTDGYRAPETYKSDVISKQTDVFSLGLTIFGIWSYGKHPFGDDIDLLNYNIKKNEGRDLSSLMISGNKKDELVALIDKMLQHDPLLRPTMEEVSQHPFFTNELNLATAASSSGQLSLGTSSEEPFPEPSFVVAKEGRELVMRRHHLDPSPQQDNSPEEPSHRISASPQTLHRRVTPGTEPRYSTIRTSIRVFTREEKASRSFRESKFEEGIVLLKDLPGRTERQQIMLAEGFFRVGKDVEARHCIERLKDIMASFSPRPNPNDVITIIENYIDCSLFIRALILLPCASRLCTSHPDSDDALRLFLLCVWRCSEVIQGMSKQDDRMKAIAADTGIKTVHAIHADLQGIHGVDSPRKADIEACCLNDIAISYDAIGKLKEAIKYSKNGYDLMQSHFGPDAPKYAVLTRLLWKRSSFNMKLGNYREVEKLCLECMTVEELAEDQHQDEKEQIMKGTRSLLKDARQEQSVESTRSTNDGK